MRMFVLLPKPLADWIAATVVPYFAAIFPRVSPFFTLWVVVLGAAALVAALAGALALVADDDARLVAAAAV